MAELDGGENEALDLVPLVTNVVLEVIYLRNGDILMGNILAGTSIDCWHCSHSRSGNSSNKFKVIFLVANFAKKKYFKFIFRGEKQRMHLRDGFLADQLDPIYVAYNM